MSKVLYDELYKIILIGDISVGKTSISTRFVDEKYNPNLLSTIGIDLKIKTVYIDGKRIKIQLWDTSGQERFKAIGTSYYRDAMGVLFVYDVTNSKTFLNIEDWVREFSEHASANVISVLIGNKCDLNDKREVIREKGQQLAQKHGMKFYETSAITKENIEESFLSLANDIRSRRVIRKSETQENMITLKLVSNEKKTRKKRKQRR